MIVTNESVVACCGETKANCTCRGLESVSEPQPVVNSDGPVGGGLGIPAWDFQPGGVVTNGYAPSVERKVTNATPGQADFSLAGAGQFEPAKQVTNAVDDKLPAGGSLGIPVWNFDPACKPEPVATDHRSAANDDKLPAGGSLSSPLWIW